MPSLQMIPLVMLQLDGSSSSLVWFESTFPLRQKSYEPLLLLKVKFGYFLDTSIVSSESLNLNSSFEFPNADKKKKSPAPLGNLSVPVD
jgi:hypothetical protein